MKDRSARLYRGPWRIDLNVRAGVPRIVPNAALARAVAAALDAAGAPQPAAVGLTLANDRELAELNEQHMGHAGPTDVLSFPLLEPVGERPFRLPPGTRQHLGDIVVSVERAIDQAQSGRGGQTMDVRWAPADELRLLVTHGTLHLCGLDHAAPEEEAAMRALEARLLGTVNART